MQAMDFTLLNELLKVLAGVQARDLHAGYGIVKLGCFWHAGQVTFCLTLSRKRCIVPHHTLPGIAEVVG